MVKKRSRLEIIYNILKTIKDKNNSIKPTPLLRYSNLSSQSFAEYYHELIQKEFIREEYDRKQRKYITLTDKGFEYLEKYRTIKNFIDELGL